MGSGGIEGKGSSDMRRDKRTAVNRSGVMKTLQGGSIDNIATGEDFDGLAIAITTLLIVHSTGRHFPYIARAAV